MYSKFKQWYIRLVCKHNFIYYTTTLRLDRQYNNTMHIVRCTKCDKYKEVPTVINE